MKAVAPAEELEWDWNSRLQACAMIKLRDSANLLMQWFSKELPRFTWVLSSVENMKPAVGTEAVHVCCQNHGAPLVRSRRMLRESWLLVCPPYFFSQVFKQVHFASIEDLEVTWSYTSTQRSQHKHLHTSVLFNWNRSVWLPQPPAKEELLKPVDFWQNFMSSADKVSEKLWIMTTFWKFCFPSW